MKKVSIIVPVYNAERFIEIGIKSVLEQTYKNIELVLVDDGSTDSSLTILKKYQKKYIDIIKVFHKENSGVGDTRNFGVDKCTGDYITFMDADDYLNNDYIEVMIKSVENNDILISGYNQVDEDHKLIFSRHIKPVPSAKYRQMVIWAKLYKKQFIIKNNIKFNELKIGEDISFSLDSYIATNKVKCINYVGYNNVSNQYSVTKNSEIKKDINITYLISVLINKCNNKKFVNNNKKELQFFFMKLFVNYLYDKARVYDYNLLYDFYLENMNNIKKFFKKNNIKYSFMYNNVEPFGINVAINIVILVDKIKFNKILVKLFCKKFNGK